MSIEMALLQFNVGIRDTCVVLSTLNDLLNGFTETCHGIERCSHREMVLSRL